MNKEKQRIAIAEACGWKYTVFSDGSQRLDYPDNKGPYTTSCNKSVVNISALTPDYLNDLNAMNEAEKVMTESQRFDYGNELYSVVKRDIRDSKAAWYWGSATAAQRAEAFLRTLGKWEEDPA